MKQDIGIGRVVDDGTGDYLRLGGEKINNNFNELYADLGDGQLPHPAGAWKTHNGGGLSPRFGQSFSVNTTAGAVRVILPNGRSGDYGKVIKLRDPWGTWSVNNVTLQVTGNNTIKGGSTNRVLYRDFQDVELVFVSPGNWEYLDNKLISRLSSSDFATVAKKEFIATEGQIDFVDVFGETPYNPANIELYRRGNLMYYGDDFSADSDFGSIGPGNTIVPMDGRTIRLRVPANAGDVITLITYLDDLAVYKTSYISRSIRVYGDEYQGALIPVPGQTWVGDLTKKRVWTFADFDITQVEGQLNPFSTEVQINGRNLIKAGTGSLPSFMCESAGVPHPEFNIADTCLAAGMEWVESGVDFSLPKDANDKYTQIKVAETLESGDILTIKWFNNDIGTVMDWEEIKSNTDDFYMNNEYRFSRSKRIRYNSYVNPNPCDVEIDDNEEVNVRFNDVISLLDSVYPIGTIYMNAHNKANPSTYMGFGHWVAYAEGRAIVGWEDGDDSNFSYYDGSCGKLVSPGGTGGLVEHELQINEVPTVSSSDQVLIKDDNGDVLIGQCLLDPDDSGPGYRRYREDVLKSNVNSGGVNLSLLQPYVTVAAWLRVA